MKKILSVFILFLSACGFVQTYDTEFKNPVFYQPLRPLSKTATWTYLTPTSYVMMTPLDKNKIATQGKCDLIENKQDRITLKCNCKWNDNTKYNSYFTYVITEIPWYAPYCLRILKYSYDKLENFPKSDTFASKYCVTPPDYMESESD